MRERETGRERERQRQARQTGRERDKERRERQGEREKKFSEVKSVS